MDASLQSQGYLLLLLVFLLLLLLFGSKTFQFINSKNNRDVLYTVPPLQKNTTGQLARL
jgi:hypothetical protein